MKFKNMIGKDFTSFQHRIIYSYIATYPDFIPSEDINICVDSQKQLYSFMRYLIEIIYEYIDILGFKELLPDDNYDGQAANEKPDVYMNTKKVEKKLFNLYTLIININNNGETCNNGINVKKSSLKLDKNKLLQLSKIGLQSQIDNENIFIWSDEYPDLFIAFPILIKNIYEKDKLNIKKFIYCILNDNVITAYNMCKNLVDKPENIKIIEDVLFEFGYKNDFGDMGRVGFLKEYKEKPIGSFFSRFDPRYKQQLSFEVRIPNFRILLQRYNEMDDDLQNISFSRLRVCNGCGYCTQTDKTGKRKPVAMKLLYKEKTEVKCPLYPWFIWNDIDEKTAEIIIKLFQLAE